MSARQARSAKALVLAVVCATTIAAWPADAASSEAAAAKLKRDAARCEKHADLDACNDAIRRKPSDAALLVGFGDALLHAKRPEDALRQYRRAAAIAPNTTGVNAKIAAAKARLASARPPVAARRAVQSTPRAPVTAAVVDRNSSGHYSNAAPETQSH